ncbi:MAG: hypothetical protein HY319_16175 [Armatimonadetes bacterium]|nr:hypothetical protein [Armatimonadota bacterium]
MEDPFALRPAHGVLVLTLQDGLTDGGKSTAEAQAVRKMLEPSFQLAR